MDMQFMRAQKYSQFGAVWKSGDTVILYYSHLVKMFVKSQNMHRKDPSISSKDFFLYPYSHKIKFNYKVYILYYIYV